VERRWKVLIVEDEALVAWSMDEVLSLVGFEVVGVAATVSEPLCIAEATKPDLAIFDVRLGRTPQRNRGRGAFARPARLARRVCDRAR
jgi:DNA-binding NarL/FixJ family response regulator